MIYFDHNATHPLLPSARDAWLDATDRYIGNPSSPHRLGDRADRALSAAREELSTVLGCSAHEIVWTSGATEANNTAIAHLAATQAGVALVSAVEHPSVLAASRRYFSDRYELIPVSASGEIDLDWLKSAFERMEVGCVIIMAANNETGVIQPFPQVLQACRERKLPYLCDATQWVGRLSSERLGELPIVTGSAHKFGGPIGVGFLKCPYALRPLIVGGPQEEGRRAGTENVPGVLSMLAALRTCVEQTGQPHFLEERIRIRESFEAELKRLVTGVTIVGSGSQRLWNTSSVIMAPARDCRQRWVVKLDRLGFAVSTGSACSSGKEQASHVLQAMGLPNDEAGRALRFSAGINTTESEWQALLKGLCQAVNELT
ncbi:MAG TPA: cysteine desulfurase family protein [Chthoniobacteraceae bacterium]|nr:cysteine desulfurase family protein [Chthoniobacteraceae bacterium]